MCGCVQCGVGFSLSRALLTHGMFAHEGLDSKQHLRLTLRNSGSQQSTEVAKTHFVRRRNGHWVFFWPPGFLAFFFEKKKCTWSSQWSPELPSEQGKGFQNMEFYGPVNRCGSFALQSIVLRFFWSWIRRHINNKIQQRTLERYRITKGCRFFLQPFSLKSDCLETELLGR